MLYPQIVQLPKIQDERGNLSFIEECNHIPFHIERTYWIYDVPGGEVRADGIRAGHAYATQQEFLVALSGSFDVVLTNGVENISFAMNRSYYGLYVPSMWWRSLENFSTNSLCMVIASTQYDERDYIRDFKSYSQMVSGL